MNVPNPKLLFLAFANLILYSCSKPSDTITIKDPSSLSIKGFYCSKSRKDIYKAQTSNKYYDWKNPTSGGAIHINKNDSIEIYQSWLEFMHKPEHFNTQIDHDKIWQVVSGVGFGNETSVLVTSEYDLKKSTSIQIILEVLCQKGVRIYYLEKDKN